MHTIHLPFTILKYIGIWKPNSWKSTWKSYQYDCWSLAVMMIMYSFVTTELIAVVKLISDHYDEISDTLFLLLTTAGVFIKSMNFLANRNNMAHLGNMLLKSCCIPKNLNELKIQKKFDDINSRFVTLMCITMVYGNIMTMMTIPLLQPKEHRNLPFNTWLPYDTRSNTLNYWLSYLHQGLGLACCGTMGVMIVNIITGFMQQACAQFEILDSRWRNLPKIVEIARSRWSDSAADEHENIMLRQHIRHHIHVYEYMNEFVKTFNIMILVQFCVSSAVITISVYQMSTKSLGLEWFMVFGYAVSMLTEFFLYCWFGNEVTLKSMDFALKIYDTEWNLLNIKSWKLILFVTYRTRKPIVVRCYNYIILSLDTYVNVSNSDINIFYFFNI
ncbi:hypothetical protein TSAR_016577 [Trichomalopsis sarcophagae]|uniref:Odorant receptor n=1 Tax=Trichomalopsis sarcophagae TaxID=543379 RepID=A0A232EKK9_9HYME|nr:hypothetical protein TSAR_016577 [Trichomalopsis sarcophagae]